MLLRPSRIADALNRGELSDLDKLRYLMVLGVLGVLTGARPGAVGGGYSDLRFIYVAIGLVVNISGLYLCFATNRRGDGRDFLERYVCLSAPLSVAIYLLFFFLYWAGWRVAVVLGHSGSADAEWYARYMSLALSMVTLATYYLWLQSLFRRAARTLAV